MELITLPNKEQARNQLESELKLEYSVTTLFQLSELLHSDPLNSSPEMRTPLLCTLQWNLLYSNPLK